MALLSYSIRRIFMLIPVLLGMSIVVFSIIRAIPGDPALTILGEKASPKAIEDLREVLGLNNPWYIQYFDYLKQIITGDLGVSLHSGASITQEIGPYLAATTELTIVSMLFAVIIGVNAGILSAWKQNSWFDYCAMLIALIGVSMPIFWLGLMEQWFFAQELKWLPSVGRDNSRNPVEAITQFYILDTIMAGQWDQLWEVVKHLILPGVALGTIPMAIIARITRSSMLEVMRADYVRTARAKGLAQFWVVYKHALKNAMIPVLTVIGLQTGLLLGGAVLTETIFGWPGVGRYIFTAIGNRDYPVIQSGILVIATIFVLINLLVDLLYAYIDPRIKYR
ncbi:MULTISPECIES: ABC transporter permease [Brevibacillus]|jgi:peptide/nickel transport system permease protein|uniref:Peptide ABC transporter permease n=1 Tax=Brevibacillus parabrevis TaxID=54914 RepID=A0A4Y3PKV4_BREPA|nr:MULTISPECIES: ABC transporter permease [Brevibacillus]MBU8714934.1 ABC transporter permease [Brevibacillus parabrevis]MDH6352940.1 peptide/nickel transport system permease protein [Brevibacillus sp. 1238]MDR5000793.1 ABC transporter permease [Brevibacillus parabrevis]MED2253100.1 ABC transporter permease [Brevibacillus parabrevis]NRQ55458.1 ABC transporter permease [Brevibacillus sp. HD1.4A]